ncbi:hypothetical protein M0R19_06290 [Candidatus Pacearchaeota archaeon]|jgi:hypothetical protein|nr:hypothetical protein [Candidatus Pacearchaeota archaeon]
MIFNSIEDDKKRLYISIEDVIIILLKIKQHYSTITDFIAELERFKSEGLK